MTITKAYLIEKISNRLGLSKADSQNLVENFFEILTNSLESGEDVKISGFGTFKLKKKNTRPGRNPITGEQKPVSARTIVKFSASSKFKSMVHD
jgi:integration host factor subunit alpha